MLGNLVEAQAAGLWLSRASFQGKSEFVARALSFHPPVASAPTFAWLSSLNTKYMRYLSASNYESRYSLVGSPGAKWRCC
jgi:hypothetical protein